MMSMAESYSRAMKAEIERKVAAQVVIDYVPGTHRRDERKVKTAGGRRAA
ncbi:MAG: hypothetical protein WAM81_03325 [Acidimicrobiia bacterium]